MRLLLTLLSLIAIFAPRDAQAHGMRSAYVEVAEQREGHATVRIKALVPVTGIRILADAPCALDSQGEVLLTLTCPASIRGAHLRIEGLGAIVSDAAVVTVFADGSSASQLVTPSEPQWIVPAAHVSWLEVAREYVGLGVKHILTGGDHLLFLVGLVLVVRRLRPLILAETAFTLSHSVSFSASALGYVHMASAPVEAWIAASLVLVAMEASRNEEARTRDAVILAFAFGLVHGLGFAGGLAEIGLPDRSIPAALAGFAAGVEMGQVAFLAFVLALFAFARRMPRVGPRLYRAATLAVGGVGACWFFERVQSLLQIH